MKLHAFIEVCCASLLSNKMVGMVQGDSDTAKATPYLVFLAEVGVSAVGVNPGDTRLTLLRPLLLHASGRGSCKPPRASMDSTHNQTRVK